MIVIRSPFLWITELLCRLAGIDMTGPVPDPAPPPPTPPDQVEASLLKQWAAPDDTATRAVIVVHFAPIVEPYVGRREHLMNVIEGSAAAAFAKVADPTAQSAWFAESLVIRFATELPAIDTTIAIARRLLGADFDPSQLPARLLVHHRDGLAFEDLWPLPLAQERLAHRWSPKAPGSGALSLSFQPLWDVATAQPTAVVCVPRLSGVNLTSDKLAMTAAQAAAVDGEVVAHVARHLAAAAGSPRFIGMPIHQTTLTDDALRTQVFAPYLALPEAARRQAIFEVVAIGAECSRLRLGSVLQPLAGTAKAVIGRFHISQTDFSDLRHAGFAAVGTDISLSQRAEAELLPMLSAFATAAEAARLPTYVQGLVSLSLKTAAQAAGFHTVAGTPLADPLADDLGAFPFSFDEMYGHAVAAVTAG